MALAGKAIVTNICAYHPLSWVDILVEYLILEQTYVWTLVSVYWVPTVSIAWHWLSTAFIFLDISLIRFTLYSAQYFIMGFPSTPYRSFVRSWIPVCTNMSSVWGWWVCFRRITVPSVYDSGVNGTLLRGHGSYALPGGEFGRYCCVVGRLDTTKYFKYCHCWTHQGMESIRSDVGLSKYFTRCALKFPIKLIWLQRNRPFRCFSVTWCYI